MKVNASTFIPAIIKDARLGMVVALLSLACLVSSGCKQVPSHPQNALRLNAYQLSAPPVLLEPQVTNASGLTFNHETGSLFMVLNGPTRILELSRTGVIIRAVDLVGFEDTEGIAHLGGTRFAVAEERRGTVAIVDIPGQATSIDYASAKTILIEPEKTGNKGLEGLSFDPIRGEFVSIREKGPRRLYRFSIAGSEEAEATKVSWDIQNEIKGLRDLSGVHIDVSRNHMLLLSDESKTVVEFDSLGEEISRLHLKKGSAGLSADVPQAEGVTIDDQATLYICSEPNLLYIFKKAGS